MISIGTIVKFSPEYKPRENDREGMVVRWTAATGVHQVRWNAVPGVQAYTGFYEEWQLVAAEEVASDDATILDELGRLLKRGGFTPNGVVIVLADTAASMMGRRRAEASK